MFIFSKNTISSLPFVIEAEAEQFVPLEVIFEVVSFGDAVIESGLNVDSGREEPVDLEIERILKFTYYTLIVGEVIESRSPACIPVEVERQVGFHLGTELVQNVVILVLTRQYRILAELESVTGQIHIAAFQSAVHEVVGDGSQVHR